MIKYKLSFEEYLRAQAAVDSKCLAARMLHMPQSELIALVGAATPSQYASPQTRKHELVQLVSDWRNYYRYKGHHADLDLVGSMPYKSQSAQITHEKHND